MNFLEMKDRPSPFLFRIMIVLFIAFILPNKGTAQSYETFNSQRATISQLRWKIGPFFIDPSFLISLSRDNNIYGANIWQDPVQDYYATFLLPVSIYLLMSDWLIFSLSEAPSYDYYFHLANERAFNNSFSANARLLLFHRLPISGGYIYAWIRERISSEVEQRVFQVTNGYSGEIFLDTSRNTSFGISGGLINYAYEDVTLPGASTPLWVALNRTEKNGRLEFYYKIFSDSSLFANFGYTDYIFDYPEARIRDSYSYQSYIGIRFPITGRARGLLSLGYKKLVPREEGVPGYSGPVGNTEVSVGLGRFTFRLEYIRDIPFSYGGGNYYVSSSYGGGLSFYLGQFLRLDYDLRYGGGDYPELEEVIQPDGSVELVKRTDTYISHAVALVFRVIKNTGIGASIVFSKRDSNIALENMNRTFVGVFVTYDF